MTGRTALLAAPALLAVLASAPSARAADVPAFGALARGRMSSVPTVKPPKAIGAHERVDGIFVVAQKFGADVPKRARHVSVLGDAAAAEAIKNGTGFAPGKNQGACFVEAARSDGGMRALSGNIDDDEDADPEAREWATTQLWQVSLWPRTEETPQNGVTAVHSEKVVEQNGRASLESVDAWIDPSSRGARLIGRSSLPLTLVGTAVGGVKVYAARDDLDEKRARVQFVVVRPNDKDDGRFSPMIAARQDGASSHGGGCGHVRMPLALGPQTGDSAIVVAPIELPPLSSAARDERAEPATQAKAPAPTDSRALVRPGKPALPAGLGVKALAKRVMAPHAAAEPAVVVEPREREVRTRDVQVHLSVSQTSRDREPVLAVSFGWLGRESVQRTVDNTDFGGE